MLHNFFKDFDVAKTLFTINDKYVVVSADETQTTLLFHPMFIIGVDVEILAVTRCILLPPF